MGGRPAVVTVTYSPGETLTAFLDSVRTAASGPVEVILADNGSTDGSVEAAALRPGVRLLRTGGNVGYGAAVNAAVRSLPPQVDLILVANPDVVLEPGSLDELVAVMDRTPNAGAVGPLILDGDGTVYPSARQLPSVGTGIGHALCGWWWPSNPWTRAYRLDRADPVQRTAGWLSGACLLVRRTAFARIGGFDEGYFMYFEDVDLGDRLGAAGWDNVYAPSAVVVHTGGHSTRRHAPAMLRAHHDSAYRYLSGRYPRLWHAPLRWVLRAGLAARGFLAVRSARVAGGAELPGRRRR